MYYTGRGIRGQRPLQASINLFSGSLIQRFKQSAQRHQEHAQASAGLA
jgi:hypothetical protein